MNLYSDIELILKRFIGKDAKTILSVFHKFEDDSQDFLDAAADFISHFIGPKETIKILRPIGRKYKLKF